MTELKDSNYGVPDLNGKNDLISKVVGGLQNALNINPKSVAKPIEQSSIKTLQEVVKK